MTELVDLITDPKEKMTLLMDQFIKRLEESQKKETQDLDRAIEHYRLKLHRQHEKAIYSYKNILEKLHRGHKYNDDAPIIEFFESMIRTKDRRLYTEVFEKALPVIREIEKEGGSLSCRIQKEGKSMHPCLEYYEGKAHFNFFWEEFEGFDKNIAFKVVKTTVDEKTRREEKEKKEAEWRATWEAKQAPRNEVILEEMKEDLKKGDSIEGLQDIEAMLEEQDKEFDSIATRITGQI
jgi:hypothetical protein